MAKTFDLSTLSDTDLVDFYAVKCEAAKDLAALVDAAKKEFADRGLRQPEATLYGHKFKINVNFSTPLTFSQKDCEAEMGKAFIDKFKRPGERWLLTVKPIGHLTSEEAEKVAAAL